MVLLYGDHPDFIFSSNHRLSGSRNERNMTFSRCNGDSPVDILVCTNEIALAITTLLLIMIQLVKIFAFNPFKTKLNWKVIWNFENTVELVVRTFASLCLIFQHDEPYLQYFSAIGIFFAFLGRFFKQNRK